MNTAVPRWRGRSCLNFSSNNSTENFKMLTLPDGKMYNFFIDDNIFFFTDIFRKKCSAIFEHFYLENLKNIHEKYGTVFTLNCFRHNHHEPDFDLSLFPDKYRSEFEDNASWLRLAFHADSEKPNRPYKEVHPEKLEEHYALWKKEMVRIAGEKTLIAPVIIHFFDALPPGRHFLRGRGMKLYAVRSGGAFAYNPEFDQIEMPVDMFLNHYFSDIGKMQEIVSEKIASGQQKFLIGSHEQYAYAHYRSYIPEYFAGVDAVCRMLTENGYEPVYYSEVIQ